MNNGTGPTLLFLPLSISFGENARVSVVQTSTFLIPESNHAETW